MGNAPSEVLGNWRLVASACTGIMFSSIVLPYYSIGALVVPVTQEFGWERAEFQMAILFSSGLGALTAPVVGWFIDRYGARRVALPSIVGLSAGFVLATFMDGQLWILYLAYGAMAILGAGTIPVTWTRAITTNFFRQRGLALGITLSGTGLCAILVIDVSAIVGDIIRRRERFSELPAAGDNHLQFITGWLLEMQFTWI